MAGGGGDFGSVDALRGKMRKEEKLKTVPMEGWGEPVEDELGPWEVRRK